jgi:hypothetical protein
MLNRDLEGHFGVRLIFPLFPIVSSVERFRFFEFYSKIKEIYNKFLKNLSVLLAR